jgi:hypothetical protein
MNTRILLVPTLHDDRDSHDATLNMADTARTVTTLHQALTPWTLRFASFDIFVAQFDPVELPKVVRTKIGADVQQANAFAITVS